MSEPINGELTEEKIWEALKGIKSPRPLEFKFGSGITRCTPGNAEGCDYGNHGLFYEITVWPHGYQYALFHGMGAPRHIRSRRGCFLWLQEEYVYRLEMRSALLRAMEEMDKLFPIPRDPEHLDSDVNPYPEDFGRMTSKMVAQSMAESIESWLRST